MASSVYNGFVADVEQDLNLPRPIVAGGTGSSSAAQSLANLGGETSSQVVTNYDSQLFMPGSFYSAAGATNAPVAGHAFVGTVVSSDPNAYPPSNQNVVVSARDQNDTAVPGHIYVREKKAGVWGPWTMQVGSAADLDASYVNVAGDTMTGQLTITAATPAVSLNKTANPNTSALFGSYNGLNRWLIELGNSISEAGSNSGSNFTINRYDDAGLLLGTPLSIDRAAGNVSVAQSLNVGGAVTSTGATINGTLTVAGGTGHYANGGLSGAYYDSLGGANRYFAGSDNVSDYWRVYAVGIGNVLTIAAAGGAVGINGPTTVSSSLSAAGGLYSTYIINSTAYDGIRITTAAGNYARFISQVNGVRTWSMGCTAAGNFMIGDESLPATRFTIDTAGTANFQGNALYSGVLYPVGTQGKYGISGGYAGVVNNFFYSGGNMLVFADDTYMGYISLVSDYRTKKDVVDLPGMWETVKALRPIKYTQAEFSPPSHIKYVASEVAKARKEAEENPEAAPREVNTGPLVPADDIERWGFIAHELQETLTPSAATATKDAPDAIQSPNPWTVIAALTGALQEAMTRIETLEAKLA